MPYTPVNNFSDMLDIFPDKTSTKQKKKTLAQGHNIVPLYWYGISWTVTLVNTFINYRTWCVKDYLLMW